MTGVHDAFALVQELADELSKGEIQLPSLPRAVVRLRNELAKPGFDVPRLATLASTEPALAASILTMANSVTFRRAGKETLDLKIAIPRIGAGKVQALAVRFAMQQLKLHAELGRSRKLLEREWALGLRVAATCYLVAEKSRAVKPDEALIVGLIHNIGRIYLYSRADRHPAIFDTPVALQELVESWHSNVARAIVESWELPAEAAEAVGRQDEDEDGAPCGDMTYVLRGALLVQGIEGEPADETVSEMAQRRAFRALRLGPAEILAIHESRPPTRLTLGLTD